MLIYIIHQLEDACESLARFKDLPVSQDNLTISVMIYGYAKVSTDGQSVEAQVAELTAAGAHQVFSETASRARVRIVRSSSVMCSSSPVSIGWRAQRAIC